MTKEKLKKLEVLIKKCYGTISKHAIIFAGNKKRKCHLKKKNHCLDPHLFLKFSAESKRSIFVLQPQKNPLFLYSPHLSTKPKIIVQKNPYYLLCSAANINGQNIDRENSKFTSTSQITVIISKGPMLWVIVLLLAMLHKYLRVRSELKIFPSKSCTLWPLNFLNSCYLQIMFLMHPL